MKLKTKDELFIIIEGTKKKNETVRRCFDFIGVSCAMWFWLQLRLNSQIMFKLDFHWVFFILKWTQQQTKKWRMIAFSFTTLIKWFSTTSLKPFTLCIIDSIQSNSYSFIKIFFSVVAIKRRFTSWRPKNENENELIVC